MDPSWQGVCSVCQSLLGKSLHCFCTLYYFILNCHCLFHLLAQPQSLESGSDPSCCLFLFPKASGTLGDVKPGILQPKSSEPFAGDAAVAWWQWQHGVALKSSFLTGWSSPKKVIFWLNGVALKQPFFFDQMEFPLKSPCLTKWSGPKKVLFWLDGVVVKSRFLTGWRGPKRVLFWVDGVAL